MIMKTTNYTIFISEPVDYTLIIAATTSSLLSLAIGVLSGCLVSRGMLAKRRRKKASDEKGWFSKGRN